MWVLLKQAYMFVFSGFRAKARNFYHTSRFSFAKIWKKRLDMHKTTLTLRLRVGKLH